MAENIILFGAGPHAQVIIDVLERNGQYRIAGLTDSEKEIGSSFNDYRILGRQEDIADLVSRYGIIGGVVCIGDNFRRASVVRQIKKIEPEFRFITAIDPSVIIGKNVTVGEGSVLMPGVIINTGSVIGAHCIVNTGSIVEHFCELHDYSSISVGVTCGGYTVLEECAAVALGVTLFDRIKIGKHAVVGSGAVVTKDVEDQALVYGVPARFIRKREKDEKFLK